MLARILKYLLLFVCEFILVWLMVIIEMLIKGYWGDTPLYFILIFMVAYALACYAWASLALTGDKKKKRQLGLISGAVVGFIAAMFDGSLGLQLLQLMSFIYLCRFFFTSSQVKNRVSPRFIRANLLSNSFL
jgi:hypothetical protein